MIRKRASKAIARIAVSAFQDTPGECVLGRTTANAMYLSVGVSVARVRGHSLGRVVGRWVGETV